MKRRVPLAAACAMLVLCCAACAPAKPDPEVVGFAAPTTPDFIAAVKSVFPANLGKGYYLTAQNRYTDFVGTTDIEFYNYPLYLFNPGTPSITALTKTIDAVNESNICALSSDLSKVLVQYNKPGYTGAEGYTPGTESRIYAAVFDTDGRQIFAFPSAYFFATFSDDLRYCAFSSGVKKLLIDMATGKEVSVNIPSGLDQRYIFNCISGDYALFYPQDNTAPPDPVIAYDMHSGKSVRVTLGDNYVHSHIVNSQVVYMTANSDGLPTKCYSANLDGSGQKFLADCTDALLSPDGQYLAYGVWYTGEGASPGDIAGSPKAGLYIKNLQTGKTVYYYHADDGRFYTNLKWVHQQ